MYRDSSKFCMKFTDKCWLSGSTRVVQSIRSGSLNAAYSMLATVGEMKAVSGLHVYISNKNSTQQFNGLCTYDGFGQIVRQDVCCILNTLFLFVAGILRQLYWNIRDICAEKCKYIVLISGGQGILGFRKALLDQRWLLTPEERYELVYESFGGPPPSIGALDFLQWIHTD